MLDQGQAKIEGRAGAARSDQGSVHHHAIIPRKFRQFILDGKMGGVAAAGEHSGIEQNRGSGTDGDDPALGGVLGAEEVEDARIGPEVPDAWTTGEKDAVEGLVQDRTQGGFGAEGKAAAAGHRQIVTEGSDRHLGAGTAQEVDGGDRFNFFETFRQDSEDSRHATS